MIRVYCLFSLICLIFSCQSDVKNNNQDVSLTNGNPGLNHYWVKYKFNANEVNNYPDLIEQSLVDYIAQFPVFQMDEVRESLDLLIKRSEHDSVFYKFLKDKFTNYLYHPNSPFRNDLYYEQVLRVYNNSPLLSKEELQANAIILDLVKKNQVGSKAENFDFETDDGQFYDLYTLEAEYKLLVFYDPLCAHCKEIISAMRESVVLNNLIETNVVKVIAIDGVGDYSNWKAYQTNIPIKWLNGFNKSRTINNNKLYSILAYPTIYLLDKDNIVLLKDVYFSVVENYFVN